MNTDLMIEVADAIDLYPEHFDMGSWFGWADVTGTPPECGTTACIAGWACTLAGLRDAEINGEWSQKAGAVLGLTDEQASREADDDTSGLFFRTDLTAETAPTFLREIAKGERVWDDEAGWVYA